MDIIIQSILIKQWLSINIIEMTFFLTSWNPWQKKKSNMILIIHEKGLFCDYMKTYVNRELPKSPGSNKDFTIELIKFYICVCV